MQICVVTILGILGPVVETTGVSIIIAVAGTTAAIAAGEAAGAGIMAVAGTMAVITGVAAGIMAVAGSKFLKFHIMKTKY